MAFTAPELAELETYLSRAECGPELQALLRRRFPGRSFTRCDDSDMTDTPYRSFERLNLYLVDARDHCVQVTTDPAVATGVVLAQLRKPK